jgi:hypothetical protein
MRYFNLRDPLLRHRTRTRATLAADDCPLDARQIGPSHGPEQRLKRNKPNGSIDLAQIVNAPKIIGALDAGRHLAGRHYCLIA